jgi:VWFA-related protein
MQHSRYRLRAFLLPCLVAASLGSAPASARGASQEPGQPAQPAPAQSPGPQESPSPSPTPAAVFPAQVELVTVDVVVREKKGDLVTDLGPEDFEIKEDGEVQKIVSFEAVSVPDAPAASAPPPPRVSSNVDVKVRNARSFVVVFDNLHMTPFQARRAKTAVAEFLKSGVREGDGVTLVATGGEAWWSTRMEAGREELMGMLKRLDGRSIPDISRERVTEYEAMRIHVFNDVQVEQRVARRFETYGVSNPGGRGQSEIERMSGGDPFVRARAADVYFQSVTKNRLTLEIMERVLDSLVLAKGRKSLILVSEGFIYDPNLDEFKRVIQSARRANTAIYFLDTRGLQGMPVYMTAQFGPAPPEQDMGAIFAESFEASEGSESLAADSGGFSVKNTNDLSKGIQRIADDTRAYYLLGYNPSNTARDGRFRKIEVKVGRKNVELRARKGYYAPTEGKSVFDKKPTGFDPVIQAALDSPYDYDQIPLRMTAFVFDETLMGKASALVATEVDISGFAFEEQEGRFNDTLEFLLVVAHRETGEFFRYDQKVEMKLMPATRERLLKSWFPIVRDFELAVGGYQAKIVVRDTNSGRVGTVVHNFEVPALEGFRVSTPLLTDALERSREDPDGPPRAKVLAHRSFSAGPGSVLFCSFDVYGAAKETGSSMPRVSAGYLIRSKTGELVTRVEPTVIQPTSLGRLSRIVGSRIEGLAPGDYELVLDVKDEIGGSSLSLQEPFTIVADAKG